VTETAGIVVVGGGVLGLAAAWRLARMGQGGDVLVLERNGLASAATAQAAALLTSARGDDATAALVAETYRAIPQIEEETGQPLDFRRSGTLHIAGSDRSRAALAGMEAQAARFGAACRRIGGEDAARLAPWLSPAPIAEALWVPGDGYLDPARLAMAYAAAARKHGVTIRAGTGVRRLIAHRGRVAGVETGDGTVLAETVILAAGAWSGPLAMSVGVGLPSAPVRSEYWITDPSPRYPRAAPVTVIPDAGAYARPEVGALLFGLRGDNALSVDPRTLPSDTTGLDLSGGDPWATLTGGAGRLLPFIPSVGEIGIRHAIAGLSTYTPDAHFILGVPARMPGLVLATGCCGAGIAASTGIGRVAAELALGLPPFTDTSLFRPDRFGPVAPFDPEFRARCADARAAKTSG
jgi:sarcosine oxidase, subunit beta